MVLDSISVGRFQSLIPILLILAVCAVIARNQKALPEVPDSITTVGQPGEPWVRPMLKRMLTRFFPPEPVIEEEIIETVEKSQFSSEASCQNWTCDHIPRSCSTGFRMKPVLRDGNIVGMLIIVKDQEHPLYKLGLRDGDVILSVNEKALNGPEALSNIYREIRDKDTLMFTVERDGIRQAFHVRTEAIHK